MDTLIDRDAQIVLYNLKAKKKIKRIEENVDIFDKEIKESMDKCDELFNKYNADINYLSELMEVENDLQNENSKRHSSSESLLAKKDSILEEFIATNDINVLPKEIQEKIHIEYLENDDKPRQIERCKIGESLQTDCKRQMKKLGYSDEQISYYLRLLLVTNDIECLPKDVQDKYVFEDCYVEVPITEELINYWTDNIITTINDIELREKDYDETHSDKAFWDSEEQVKAQSFYFANLCSYSRFKHKPYDEYLKKQEQLQTERDNLYKNVGVQSSDYEVSNSDTEYDLSWLDDLV